MNTKILLGDKESWHILLYPIYVLLSRETEQQSKLHHICSSQQTSRQLSLTITFSVTFCKQNIPDRCVHSRRICDFYKPPNSLSSDQFNQRTTVEWQSRFTKKNRPTCSSQHQFSEIWQARQNKLTLLSATRLSRNPSLSVVITSKLVQIMT